MVPSTNYAIIFKIFQYPEVNQGITFKIPLKKILKSFNGKQCENIFTFKDY